MLPAGDGQFGLVSQGLIPASILGGTEFIAATASMCTGRVLLGGREGPRRMLFRKMCLEASSVADGRVLVYMQAFSAGAVKGLFPMGTL